jgi:hypothetical protein
MRKVPRLEVAFGTGMQDMNIQPERAGRGLNVRQLCIGSRHRRIDEHADDRGRGHEAVQHFQLLRA